MPRKAKPPAARFWPKVDRRGPNECWPWLASRTSTGYGKFGWLRRNQWIHAHRAAYILHFGVVPTGLDVDHLCHNPSCVNPAHLEAVSHAENMRRTRRSLATRCQRGHEYDGSTSPSTGRRFCRECAVMRERKRDRRKATTVTRAPLPDLTPTCRVCGTDLDDTGCLACDTCAECIPGTCYECRELAAEDAGDYAWRAGREVS